MHGMTGIFEPERWYVTGCGNEWRMTSGGATAVVWLDNDEKTYIARIRKSGGKWLDGGRFDDLKVAKASCLEELGKLGSCLEVIDDTA